MAGQDWLVTEDGRCEICPSVGRIETTPKYYRLYHFLSDLEYVLNSEPDDRRRLQMICPLVRHLLMSSYWLQNAVRKPDPDKGWSVFRLYDEPFFPWTVQTVSWLPAKVSEIHNHATWGLVAVIRGQEKNTFWRRKPDSSVENAVEKVGERILVPGDIITFVPDAIHNIEPLGDEPAVTLTLYGEPQGEVIYFNAVETVESVFPTQGIGYTNPLQSVDSVFPVREIF